MERRSRKSPRRIIEEYLAQATQLKAVDKKLLNYFLIYTDKYAGITQIDEFAMEDIEEFFLFWLLQGVFGWVYKGPFLHLIP